MQTTPARRWLGRAFVSAWCLSPMVPNAEGAAPARAPAPRFEVRLGSALPQAWPQKGRLLVALAPRRTPTHGPRFAIGQVEPGAPIVLGRDVDGLAPGAPAVLDQSSTTFPPNGLERLEEGTYDVQAVLHTNPDLNYINAPGDLYGPARTVRLADDEAGAGATVVLELDRAEPPETVAPDSEFVKHVRIRSDVLSRFHGRPIMLRAGVVLPRDFDARPERRYPVRVQIGGYAARYTHADGLMAPGSAFRRAWLADDAPRMLLVHLDGAGPLGDPYQVDSANHGPYGTALMSELLPHIERRFRGGGHGTARALTGSSTGGWVALALQIFYPDEFNGAWAFCPDSVDFQYFELVNIYRDENAYVNRYGFERPSARDISGEVRYTMRHECQMENVLGRGGSYALSGGQWGAWNAVYGARGADGLPVPLWGPTTGRIHRAAAEHWKNYDLRRVLQDHWAELGPKLNGKLHVWVGADDDYFLNNAVRELDAFLSRAQPPYHGTITFGPRQGHCWQGISEQELMRQMAERIVGGRR